MSRPIYTYHFEPAQHGFSLGCGRLAREIVELFHVPHGAGRAGIRPPSPGRSSDDDTDGDDEKDTGADLENAEMWAQISQLRWVIISDRPIDVMGVTTLLADLAIDGQLEAVRLAFRRAIDALINAYPTLARADRPTLAQLVALGRDMAISSGDSPDLFEFIKKELQPVDLADMLRV